MKCLTLIVHASAKRDVADRLRNIPAVSGFTLVPCEGHSAETGQDVFQSVRDRVVGYVPRIRVDVILEESQVKAVLEALKKEGQADARIGIWFITEIHETGTL